MPRSITAATAAACPTLWLLWLLLLWAPATTAQNPCRCTKFKLWTIEDLLCTPCNAGAPRTESSFTPHASCPASPFTPPSCLLEDKWPQLLAAQGLGNINYLQVRVCVCDEIPSMHPMYLSAHAYTHTPMCRENKRTHSISQSCRVLPSPPPSTHTFLIPYQTPRHVMTCHTAAAVSYVCHADWCE